jgi:transposase
LTSAKEESMAFSHDEERVRAERARAIGLFRYSLVREAADRKLSTKHRGRLVRAMAEREHEGPFGLPVRVSRATIDRWIRDWRRGGFDALVPAPRRVQPRTPAGVLDLAVALKRETPARTAAQVAAILREHAGWAPDERTLQRHFARLELRTRPDGSPPRAFGRFEAGARNERWTGDALHGPSVAGRKTYLFAFIDDHSRALVGTGGDMPRTPSAWRLRCARRSPRAVSRHRSTSITAALLSTRSCCVPARRWGSGLSTPGRASPPAAAKSSGSSGPCAISSSSSSACPRGRSPAWPS